MEHAPGMDLGECARLTVTEQPSTHTNSTHLGPCLKLLTTLGAGTAGKLRHGIPSHSSWQTVIWAFRLRQSSSRALPCPPPGPSRPPRIVPSFQCTHSHSSFSATSRHNRAPSEWYPWGKPRSACVLAPSCWLSRSASVHLGQDIQPFSFFFSHYDMEIISTHRVLDIITCNNRQSA